LLRNNPPPAPTARDVRSRIQDLVSLENRTGIVHWRLDIGCQISDVSRRLSIVGLRVSPQRILQCIGETVLGYEPQPAQSCPHPFVSVGISIPSHIKISLLTEKTQLRDLLIRHFFQQHSQFGLFCLPSQGLLHKGIIVSLFRDAGVAFQPRDLVPQPEQFGGVTVQALVLVPQGDQIACGTTLLALQLLDSLVQGRLYFVKCLILVSQA